MVHIKRMSEIAAQLGGTTASNADEIMQLLLSGLAIRHNNRGDFMVSKKTASRRKIQLPKWEPLYAKPEDFELALKELRKSGVQVEDIDMEFNGWHLYRVVEK